MHNYWHNLWVPQGRSWLLRNLAGSWLRREQRGDKRYDYRGIREFYLHLFTAGELRRLLRSTGWTIVPVERDRLDRRSPAGATLAGSATCGRRVGLSSAGGTVADACGGSGLEHDLAAQRARLVQRVVFLQSMRGRSFGQREAGRQSEASAGRRPAID